MSSTRNRARLFVDRILHTPMRYPANYGFVPHTLSPDGDPIDALVVARSPFIPGSVVRARPIARAVPRGRAWRRREADLTCRSIRPFLIIREVGGARGPARDRLPAGRAFLHPLQRPGARQMGAGRPLGRRRGSEARALRSDRAGQGEGLTSAAASAMVARFTVGAGPCQTKTASISRAARRRSRTAP